MSSDSWRDEILPYLTGHLSVGEREEFERALEIDVELRAETAALRATLEKLRSLPLPSDNRDLTPQVMARIRAAVNRRIIPLRIGKWAAAAAIAIAAGLWLQSNSQPTNPRPDGAAQRGRTLACDWLARNQTAEGGWDMARHGGQRRHAAGVAGLALLALLEGGKQYGAAAQRAADYLPRQQEECGRFGPVCGAAMYNHGIATFALLKAYAVTPAQEMRQALSSAIAFTLRSQTESGGWGHEGRRDERPNTAATVWQIAVLQEAAKLGWQDARRFLDRSGRYLDNLVDAEGNVAYGMERSGPNTALGAAAALCLANHHRPNLQKIGRRILSRHLPEIATYLQSSHDLYLAFFLAQTKAALDDKATEPILAAYAQNLLAAQITAGQEAGSVPAQLDPHGSAGGTVYSTALSALVLCRL